MNNLNTQELRQQLESHVLTIETLRGESRSLMARHENVWARSISSFTSIILFV